MPGLPFALGDEHICYESCGRDPRLDTIRVMLMILPVTSASCFHEQYRMAERLPQPSLQLLSPLRRLKGSACSGLLPRFRLWLSSDTWFLEDVLWDLPEQVEERHHGSSVSWAAFASCVFVRLEKPKGVRGGGMLWILCQALSAE